MANLSADARRNMQAAQRRIKHFCSCGRMFVGNPGWASHKRAHEGATFPPHSEISYRRFVEMHDQSPREESAP